MNFKGIKLFLIIFLSFSINIFGANKKSNITKPKDIKASYMNKSTEKSEFTIAYVNLNKIITFDPSLLSSSSQEWQKHYILLQEALSPLEVELKALEEKFEKGRTEFESLQKSGLASNEALQQKYEDIARIELELRKKFQEREHFAQEEVKKIQLKMTPNIEKAIHEIRQDKGYTMVVRSEFVVEADPSLDITSDVLSIMNKSYLEEIKAKEKLSESQEKSSESKE